MRRSRSLSKSPVQTLLEIASLRGAAPAGVGEGPVWASAAAAARTARPRIGRALFIRAVRILIPGSEPLSDESQVLPQGVERPGVLRRDVHILRFFLEVLQRGDQLVTRLALVDPALELL